MSARDLGTLLLHPIPKARLLEALRSLQRRSLIESQAQGFGLQNVVTEYLSDRLADAVRAELESGEFRLMHRVALLNAQAKVYGARRRPASSSRRLSRAWPRCMERPRCRFCSVSVCAHSGRRVGTPSFAAGNLLNLLVHVHADLSDADFSQLDIRQAYLQEVTLHRVDFRGAHFSACRFTNHFGRVKSMAVSPDGTRLALGTDDGEVRIWRGDDGELERMLLGFTGRGGVGGLQPGQPPAGGQQFAGRHDPSLGRGHRDILAGCRAMWTGRRRSRSARTARCWPAAADTTAPSACGTWRASPPAAGNSTRDWSRRWPFTPTARPGHGRLRATLPHRAGRRDPPRRPDAAGPTGHACPAGRRHAHQRAGLQPRRPAPGHGVHRPHGALVGRGGSSALMTLAGHQNEVRALEFDRSGRLLASAGDDFTIRLWDW
ncbi:MAG: pentapeptide repeat-containing protein [Caldilineaceae bacterium]